jgi:mRNA interferase MazF
VTYRQFDVVRVPFPFTDKESSKRRPALILSQSKSFNTPAAHSVMAMITSLQNLAWPLDHAISDLKSAGLPAPSVIRCKLFTLDHRLVRGVVGKLGKKDQLAVRAMLGALLDA